MQSAEFMHFHPVALDMLQNASHFFGKTVDLATLLTVPESSLIILFLFDECVNFQAKPILN